MRISGTDLGTEINSLVNFGCSNRYGSIFILVISLSTVSSGSMRRNTDENLKEATRYSEWTDETLLVKVGIRFGKLKKISR